jgi:hypothetical protein
VSGRVRPWSGLQTSHFTLPTRPKAVRAKQTQFGLASLVCGGRNAPNKANLPPAYWQSRRRGRLYKQTQFEHKWLKEKRLWCIGHPGDLRGSKANPRRPIRKPVVQTKPIRGSTRSPGRIVQNKANSRRVGHARRNYRRSCRWGTMRQKKPICARGAGRAWYKQTQFGPPRTGLGPQGKRCKTKPIRQQVVAGKGVMVNRSARRFRRSEPTLLGSNARNEPNLEGLSCKTKPIRGANRAKRTQFPTAPEDGAWGTWATGQSRRMPFWWSQCFRSPISLKISLS